jgi:hypothetical protein
MVNAEIFFWGVPSLTTHLYYGIVVAEEKG